MNGCSIATYYKIEHCKLLIIYMKKFFNSDWLRAVYCFEIQCQKMKYNANFIGYKIQPFLAGK
jgi:hypothetical protein